MLLKSSVCISRAIISFTKHKTPRFYSTCSSMDLKKVVQRLNQYASKDLACDWDNVGLLVEPSNAAPVKKMLITNDLTDPVLSEAIKLGVNLIVSYHPAIFYPLKRLTQSEWKERSIVKLIENRIALYSPHTSWDSVDGGMNDWLINIFDPKSVEPVSTIKATTFPTEMGKNVRININTGLKAQFLDALKSNQSVRFMNEKALNSSDDVELEFVCGPKGVIQLTDLLKSKYDAVFATLRIVDLDKPLLKNTGLARLGVLREPTSMHDVLEKLKAATKLKHVRLALANGKTRDDKVKSIVIGAGSGSKLLNNTTADLIITGEFAHHEILHETHRGVSVILTDHTNTERCYFAHFKQKFSELLAQNGDEPIEMLISETDRDPLEVV